MPSVRTERRGAVLLLTLDRPGNFNAFDVPMAEELLDAVEAAAHDASVGSVVLTGAGRAFCAGGDVQAMAASAKPQEVFLALTKRFHPIVEALATMEKPTIAAVNGIAAGGGLPLALACDLRIASTQAKFKAAYLTLGVVPDGGSTWFLPRLVGPALARSLLLLDEALDAERAFALGLVQRVVPPDQLLDEALALAQRCAALPRFAAARTKRLLAQSSTTGLHEQLADERRLNAQSAAKADLREGLAAFQGKRPPRFPSASQD